MEDISRELEKEIESARPKPYKQNRRTRLLIVDDFGLMKSGDYLQKFVKYLSLITVVCFVAAVMFCYLYMDLSKDSTSIKTKLDIAEKKVNKLNREKEVLMAKLVISGDKLDIDSDKIVQRPLVAFEQEIKYAPIESEYKNKKTIVAKIETKVTQDDTEEKKENVTPESIILNKPDSNKSDSNKSEKKINKTVTIENFIVKKSKSNKDLLVRFDIRKIAKKSGDVSGRIFTVLRSDNIPENQWLVVPATTLINGMPSEYNKGQYFSIANFKPVKFRITNQSDLDLDLDPDFFKQASIFIFNEQKDLIFQKLVNITEAR